MIRIPQTAEDWLQATALLHDYVEWLRVAVGVEPLVEQPALRHELDDLAGTYDGEAAQLFVAFDGTTAVGMVAVRQHRDHGGHHQEIGRSQPTAELKRMYVRPVARGRGLADQLIDQVVDVAKADGAQSIWLETMRGVMDPAIAVYRRNGFEAADGVEQTIVLDGMVVLERTLEPALAC